MDVISCQEACFRLDVSPTVISSDLIPPPSTERPTLPEIATFLKPILCTRPWGNDSTAGNSSGGTLTRRTSRHYGSACNTPHYNTNPQPYQLSSTVLSRCRFNDQLLPKPLQSVLRKHMPWPRTNPYTSHISKTEIPPKGWMNPQYNHEFLSNFSNSLYCKTSYQDQYKSHHHQAVSNDLETPNSPVQKPETRDMETQTDPSLLSRPSQSNRPCDPAAMDMLATPTNSGTKVDAATQTYAYEMLLPLNSVACKRRNKASEESTPTQDDDATRQEVLKAITCKTPPLTMKYCDWIAFKHKAHLKFAAEHPEIPPNPNVLLIANKKKMFFYGVHTSVFR